jgi:two-component system OmpR family sensor kinase
MSWRPAATGDAMRTVVKIYLYSLLTILIAAGMVAFTLAGPIAHRRSAELGEMSRLYLEELARDRDDPAALRRDLARVQGAMLQIALYDPDGRLIASRAGHAIPALPAADLATVRERDVVQVRRLMYAHAIRSDGRLIAVGVVGLPVPWPWEGVIEPLLLLLGVLLLAAIAFTGHFARPLQRIASAARRFGRGELDARTGVRRRDEIGEVGRTFDEMAARITRLVAAQQELMANVSHELQTPLARIQVAIDLVADGVTDRAKELLPGIAEDVAELERLIDDVMTIARFDLARSDGRIVGPPLRLAPTSVEDLIDHARARFCAQHDSHAVLVELAGPLPRVAADPVLLRRVIDNLADNARKYSDPGSEIRISAAPAPAGVAIAVADRGVGLDAADLAQVFTPFFRSDRSRSRATGGVGLGLVMSRRIVEAHGGTIRIASALGRGTTVTVELPGLEDAAA